jgi:membrane-associated phospholipid phosphatase
MKIWAARTIRQLCRLELYEVVGLMVSAVAVLIFFLFSGQLDNIIGVKDFHWRVVDNVVGVYQNPLAWTFTGALAVLLVLAGFFRRANHEFLRSLTYVIRILIAFCVMLAIYEIVNFYITVFNPHDRDTALQAIDRAICFGKLPSEWMESIISTPLTDILSGAYMSWFALTYGTILLMMTHSRKAVVEYVFTALATFYIGYLTYVLVPAIGPIYTISYAHPIGGIAASFVAGKSLVAHDCFPSLHTSITIVMVTFVYRYRRKWLWLYAPMALLIIWSTLYLRFHYAIDVIAGFALALVMTQLAPRMVASWERFRTRNASVSVQVPSKLQVAREAMSELA